MPNSTTRGSIIGKPIETLCITNSNVPSFIPVACDFIQNFLNRQGLFRTCGDQTVVEDLAVLFNHPQVAVPPSATVDDVCSCVKQWLNQLPEPLICPRVFNQYFSPDNISSVRDVLEHLPRVNRCTVARIFAMLQQILDNSDVNQMGFGNLSFCFFGVLTQNSKDLKGFFPCQAFFTYAQKLIVSDGDSFDFDLQAGHDEDLQMEVASAPVWNVEQYKRKAREASTLTPNYS